MFSIRIPLMRSTVPIIVDASISSPTVKWIITKDMNGDR